MSLYSPPGTSIRILTEEDRAQIETFLDRDRIGNLYLRSLVHQFGVKATNHLEHGRMVGFLEPGRMRAIGFLGNSRNLTTSGRPEDVEALLPLALDRPEGPRLFVGPAEHARYVRRQFARCYRSPFIDREQPYYVLHKHEFRVENALSLRAARLEDLSDVAQAQGVMTEEDLGIPHTHLDHDRLRTISERRIAGGKIWVYTENGRFVFKTEEAARTTDGLLVGGVFTDPDHRGRGIATRALAGWAEGLFADGLSYLVLHVSGRNRPAIRAYERVGFRRIATLRLMLAY